MDFRRCRHILMRVLHICQSLAGGIASYFDEIAASQTHAFGIDGVRFLIPQGSADHLTAVPARQIVEFAPSSRSIRGLLALGREAHRLVGSFDPTIVHLHSTFAGAVVRPCLLLSSRRPKVVYCAHGWAFGMDTQLWKKVVYSLVEHSLLPLTDMIVNVSHWESNLALSYGFKPERMKTIRNGISMEAPLKSGPQRAVEFPRDKINLLFVGRDHRAKGLDYLLQVMARGSYPGLHLHVVGAAVLAADRATPAGAGVADITHHGWLSRDQVSQMMAQADALIVPSRWEAFGLAALEAMRLGTPVIASRRGGLTEIVDHGRTGLHFSLEDPADLDAVLKGLDRSHLRQLGLNARQDFLRAFVSSRMNAELLSLYDQVAMESDRLAVAGALKKTVQPG